MSCISYQCLCFTCTGSYFHEESLKVRRRIKHSAKQCTPSTVFTSEETLTTQTERDTGEQLYSCSQCGKRFSSNNSLRAHAIIHTSKYKCTECGKCCYSSRTLAEHRRTHSGEKPFECTVCSKRFTKSGDLVRHSRIHSGEKPYKCRMCDKAFSVSGHLNRHMRVHTGDKPYKCSLCDKSFSPVSYTHLTLPTNREV